MRIWGFLVVQDVIQFAGDRTFEVVQLVVEDAELGIVDFSERFICDEVLVQRIIKYIIIIRIFRLILLEVVLELKLFDFVHFFGEVIQPIILHTGIKLFRKNLLGLLHRDKRLWREMRPILLDQVLSVVAHLVFDFGRVNILVDNVVESILLKVFIVEILIT